MDKALRYLALAAKAGKLLVGAEEWASCQKPSRDWLVLTASDAAEGTVRRVRELAERRRVPMAESAYTRNDIAHAIGRSKPVAGAVICDKGLAGAFARAAARTQEQEERTYEPDQIPRA